MGKKHMSLPSTINPVLLDIVNQIPPKGSQKVEIKGAEAQGWVYKGKLYLRTPLTLISPGWIGKLSGADGSTHAYEITELVSQIILLDNGEMKYATVEGYLMSGTEGMYEGRNRLLVILSVFILFLVVLYFGYGYISGPTSNAISQSTPKAPKSIGRTTGGEVANIQAAKLVNEQNIESLKAAERSGTSVVPIIIGKDIVGGDVKASNVKINNPCTIENVKRAREAGVSAFELKCQGCSAKVLKEAGFSAGELAAAGYSAKALMDAGFSAADLRAAGFTASQLLSAGYSAKDLLNAGYTAGDLKSAGVTASELKSLGLSASQLRAAGFSVSSLMKAGFNDQLKNAGYTQSEIERAEVDGELKGVKPVIENCDPANVKKALKKEFPQEHYEIWDVLLLK